MFIRVHLTERFEFTVPLSALRFDCGLFFLIEVSARSACRDTGAEAEDVAEDIGV